MSTVKGPPAPGLAILVTDGQRTDAFALLAFSKLSVVATSSVLVEYSLNSVSEIENDVATWTTWDDGASGTMSDITHVGLFVRIQPTGGNATYEVTPATARELFPGIWQNSPTTFTDIVVTGGLTADSVQVNDELTNLGSMSVTGASIFIGTVAANGGFAAYGAAPAAQHTHIADPTDGAIIDAESRTAINAILDVLQSTGLMAT